MNEDNNATSGMYGQSPLLGAMPVFRSGDNVFILNQPPLFSTTAMKVDSERLLLKYDNYRCPFNFITEHPQWFEWHKRLHFDKQTTGRIITDMLTDVKRIKAHKIDREIMFRVMYDVAFQPHSPRYVAMCGAT